MTLKILEKKTFVREIIIIEFVALSRRFCRRFSETFIISIFWHPFRLMILSSGRILALKEISKKY